MDGAADGSRRFSFASSRAARRTSESGTKVSTTSAGPDSRSEIRLASTRRRVRHGQTKYSPSTSRMSAYSPSADASSPTAGDLSAERSR